MQHRHPRHSGQHDRHTKKPISKSVKPLEHSWIRTIPDMYPDILRSPAVTFKSERDLPRIQANKYVVFTRPYKGKQGLLIIGKDSRPAIINEDAPDAPYICPMRLDRESVMGTWIFGISIFKAENLIQLEDCIVANGEQLRSSKTFQERYAFLERFTNTMWFKDKEFQGTDIQVATFFPLESIQQAMATINGGCICLMPDSPLNRLLKVTSVIHSASNASNASNAEFLCNPIEGKPDVYMLTQDGKDMGRACIQTLSISHALQEQRSSGPTKVLCTWNPEFESYCVMQIL